MNEIFRIAWDRFNVIAKVIGDVQGWVITTVFYCTILVPFAIISRFTTDPLHQKTEKLVWLKREPVPDDLESAQQQG